MAGIYLHIPFCKQACHYCNFHFSVSLKTRNDFVTALLKEINLQRDYLQAEKIDTIYFGGGTPSLLDAGELKRILEELYNVFGMSETPEITLEANPDDITPQKSWELSQIGFNRISLGVQSFADQDLLWMNRSHNASQALQAVRALQEAGISNLSLDLIYGLPGMDAGRWQDNVSRTLDLGIPHLSCYALTVEPKTALSRMIQLAKRRPVDPDEQASQFLLLMEWMQQAGYEHYEISNFALPGNRSRHNSSYWQGKKYLGLGPSAHSYDGLSRQWNLANNILYIKSLDEGKVPFELETLSPAQQLNEYIMISLRTQEGIGMDLVAAKFGKQAALAMLPALERYKRELKLENISNRVVLTREGKLLADGIASDLFFTENP